jgi:flagellar basal-body rod protein FlgC
MNLFGMMDISASALKAERVRAEVVASNMANAETTKTEDGTPYQRQQVLFAAQGGGAGSFQNELKSRLGIAAPPSFGLLGTSSAADNVAGGVAVAGVIADQNAPLRRFDPQDPDAGDDGYVSYPDINPLTEMVDLMGATRAYGMNASAVQAEKGLVSTSLDLLK